MSRMEARWRKAITRQGLGESPPPRELVPEPQEDVPDDENLLPFQSLALALGWESVIREACSFDTAVAAYVTMKSACDLTGTPVVDAFVQIHAAAEKGQLNSMMLQHYKYAHGLDYDDPELAD